MTNIYVGNLRFNNATDDLQIAFSQFGNVERVRLVTDPYHGLRQTLTNKQ